MHLQVEDPNQACVILRIIPGRDDLGRARPLRPTVELVNFDTRPRSFDHATLVVSVELLQPTTRGLRWLEQNQPRRFERLVDHDG